jgi:hypothetical protein
VAFSSDTGILSERGGFFGASDNNTKLAILASRGYPG